MQIAKNIYWVGGMPYGENSNMYAIHTDAQIILIDCGYDEAQAQTAMNSLQYWNLDGLPIGHAFITHSHFDHSGNAAYFEKQGTVLHAGAADAEAMLHGDDRTIGYAFMGRKYEKCKHIENVEDGAVYQFGDTVIEAIHVPGHTQGSMIYRTVAGGKSILFTGDYLLIEGDCADVELGWNGGPDYDAGSYLESIRKTKDLEIDMLLTGHRSPCLRNGSAMLNMLYKEALIHLR